VPRSRPARGSSSRRCVDEVNQVGLVVDLVVEAYVRGLDRHLNGERVVLKPFVASALPPDSLEQEPVPPAQGTADRPRTTRSLSESSYRDQLTRRAEQQRDRGL
jgi:hypothetical protein